MKASCFFALIVLSVIVPFETEKSLVVLPYLQVAAATAVAVNNGMQIIDRVGGKSQ